MWWLGGATAGSGSQARRAPLQLPPRTALHCATQMRGSSPDGHRHTQRTTPKGQRREEENFEDPRTNKQTSKQNKSAKSVVKQQATTATTTTTTNNELMGATRQSLLLLLHIGTHTRTHTRTHLGVSKEGQEFAIAETSHVHKLVPTGLAVWQLANAAATRRDTTARDKRGRYKLTNLCRHHQRGDSHSQAQVHRHTKFKERTACNRPLYSSARSKRWCTATCCLKFLATQTGSHTHEHQTVASRYTDRQPR